MCFTTVTLLFGRLSVGTVLSHPEQSTLNALFESDPNLITDIVDLLKSDRAVPMFLKTAGFRCLQAFVQAQMRYVPLSCLLRF